MTLVEHLAWEASCLRRLSRQVGPEARAVLDERVRQIELEMLMDIWLLTD